MENKRLCPILNQAIDDLTCFDIHMVVDGIAPKHTAPDNVFKREDYKKICMTCPYHIHED